MVQYNAAYAEDVQKLKNFLAHHKLANADPLGELSSRSALTPVASPVSLLRVQCGHVTALRHLCSQSL